MDNLFKSLNKAINLSCFLTAIIVTIIGYSHWPYSFNKNSLILSAVVYIGIYLILLIFAYLSDYKIKGNYKIWFQISWTSMVLLIFGGGYIRWYFSVGPIMQAYATPIFVTLIVGSKVVLKIIKYRVPMKSI